MKTIVKIHKENTVFSHNVESVKEFRVRNITGEKEMKVEVKIGEFMNKPTISIYEVKNDKVEDKPIVSFGIKKAQAILAAIEDIKKFVMDN